MIALSYVNSHEDKNGSVFKKFRDDLFKRWQATDEGDLSDYLNIEICRHGNKVTLHQKSYIEKLAAKYLPNPSETTRRRWLEDTCRRSFAATGIRGHGSRLCTHRH